MELPLDANYWRCSRWQSLRRPPGGREPIRIVLNRIGCCTFVLHGFFIPKPNSRLSWQDATRPDLRDGVRCVRCGPPLSAAIVTRLVTRPAVRLTTLTI